MRVRIVSYEDINAWILGKFARKLNEELVKLGVDSDIDNVRDPNADINHHIIYMGLHPSMTRPNDTLMVTHIDDIRKWNLLEKQMEIAAVGVCMSGPLMNELIARGMPAEKLCYINPAHDDTFEVRPFVIGITTQVKADGCKREHLLEELSKSISPQLFVFKIMGSGWEPVIMVLIKRGFQVSYTPEFVYDEYVKMVPTFDYYLYLGQDEGSMGFVDALAAGVKTIVTPQGFHLDIVNGITYPFNELDELVAIFNTIAQEKLKLTESVAHWTWRHYAIKHYEVWKYLLDPGKKQFETPYRDGVKSLISKKDVQQQAQKISASKLYIGSIKKFIYKVRTGFSDFDTFKRRSRSFFRNLLN